MKKYIYGVLLLFAFPLVAQVNFMTVTDEDQHSRAEDFYHTFEYFISSPGMQGSKCQATRIAPRWFATAAHCVATLCQSDCTLQIDLLDKPVSVLAQATHSAKKPVVFVHPGYRSDQLVKNDFALFRLDLNNAPKTYYRRANAKNPQNVAMSFRKFTNWLARNPKAKSEYQHVLSPQLPPVAVFPNGNYVLDRKLSVISIFDGKRIVKPDPNPVYYVKQLGYAYTKNFGVRRGMSGSGVMTNTGELIGIISAYVTADLYKGKTKLKHENLFMFPVFNETLMDFMREVMGNEFTRVEQKDAYPYLAKKTSKDFSEVVKIVKSQAGK